MLLLSDLIRAAMSMTSYLSAALSRLAHLPQVVVPAFASSFAGSAVQPDACGLQSLSAYDIPTTLYWVLAFLCFVVFPSLGYSEPFLAGFCGFSHLPRWCGQLSFQTLDFADDRGHTAGDEFDSDDEEERKLEDDPEMRDLLKKWRESEPKVRDYRWSYYLGWTPPLPPPPRRPAHQELNPQKAALLLGVQWLRWRQGEAVNQWKKGNRKKVERAAVRQARAKERKEAQEKLLHEVKVDGDEVQPAVQASSTTEHSASSSPSRPSTPTATSVSAIPVTASSVPTALVAAAVKRSEELKAQEERVRRRRVDDQAELDAKLKEFQEGWEKITCGARFFHWLTGPHVAVEDRAAAQQKAREAIFSREVDVLYKEEVSNARKDEAFVDQEKQQEKQRRKAALAHALAAAEKGLPAADNAEADSALVAQKVEYDPAAYVAPGRAELRSRYYYQVETCQWLFKFKNALEKTKVAVLLALFVVVSTVVMSDSWLKAVNTAKEQVVWTPQPPSPPLGRRLLSEEGDDLEWGGGGGANLALSGFNQSVADWHSLDTASVVIAGVAAFVLANFYFIQLGALKQGKMNTHMAAQIQLDPKAREHAAAIKARADVIVHSTKKLERAAGVIVAGLTTVLSGLFLRQTLAVASCRGWDELAPDDVRAWRNHAGLIMAAGNVIVAYALISAGSAAWNVLVEQLRLELGVEEPFFFELHYIYSRDIRHSDKDPRNMCSEVVLFIVHHLAPPRVGRVGARSAHRVAVHAQAGRVRFVLGMPDVWMQVGQREAGPSPHRAEVEDAEAQRESCKGGRQRASASDASRVSSWQP